MQQYLNSKKNLVLINLPIYSPDLNPQENIWNRLKNCIFSNRARANIEDLFNDIVNIYRKLNQNHQLILQATSIGRISLYIFIHKNFYINFEITYF